MDSGGPGNVNQGIGGRLSALETDVSHSSVFAT